LISKDLINWISNKSKINSKDLIEKDLYLHGLLLDLSNSEYFKKNFAFKGGTALAKAYFDYYRFSEDLDFTFLGQKKLENKSGKQLRSFLSKEINKIGDLLKKISKKRNMKFNFNKKNKKFVEFGGSNKFVTFKLWFKPFFGNEESFIKIQINFYEILFYKQKKIKLNSLFQESNKELSFLFPEFAENNLGTPELLVYDLREIASEKIRALLTRKGFKIRDIIDLYFLSKKGITLEKVEEKAIKKTIFMLNYIKYKNNIINRKFEEPFYMGDEERLLLYPMKKEFEKFQKEIFEKLNKVVKKINLRVEKNKFEDEKNE
jgi:predicted nucleotidyltransferase component of viral defense system